MVGAERRLTMTGDPVPPHQSSAAGILFHIHISTGGLPQRDDVGGILRDGGPTKLLPLAEGRCGRRSDGALGADRGGGEEGHADDGRRGDEALVSPHCSAGQSLLASPSPMECNWVQQNPVLLRYNEPSLNAERPRPVNFLRNITNDP